jgi:hypothetical protein
LRHDDAESDSVNDERAATGVEHLQAAAREMIEAARAFLDVIDDFVGDDDKVASVAEAFGSLARGAARAARSEPEEDSRSDDDGFEGRVQHIRVS